MYLPNGCLVAKRPQQRCRKLRAVAEELRAQDLGVRKAPRQLEASHLQTCEKRQRRQRRFKIKEGSDSELIFHLRFMAMYIYNYSWWDVNWIYHLSEWIKTHLATSVTYIHHHSSDVAEFGRYSLSKSKGYQCDIHGPMGFRNLAIGIWPTIPMLYGTSVGYFMGDKNDGGIACGYSRLFMGYSRWYKRDIMDIEDISTIKQQIKHQKLR